MINWLSRVAEKYPTELTAVVCKDNKEAQFALGMLEPTFRSAVRIGDQDSFSFDEGIVISDVRNLKGLEFMNVLIWNPSAQNYPKNRQAKNRLYVAMTRAEENLSLVTWNKPSRLLPGLHSKLVRGIDTRDDE